MVTVRGKCSACGAPLELAVADSFAGATLAGALCPGCTDKQFLAGNGAILRLRQDHEGALCPLGKVTITGGAVKALAGSVEHAAIYLARHSRGDGRPWQDQQEQCARLPGPHHERIPDRARRATVDDHLAGRPWWNYPPAPGRILISALGLRHQTIAAIWARS